jgi:hypothetical protein
LRTHAPADVEIRRFGRKRACAKVAHHGLS